MSQDEIGKLGLFILVPSGILGKSGDECTGQVLESNAEILRMEVLSSTNNKLRGEIIELPRSTVRLLDGKIKQPA